MGRKALVGSNPTPGATHTSNTIHRPSADHRLKRLMMSMPNMPWKCRGPFYDHALTAMAAPLMHILSLAHTLHGYIINLSGFK